jgi:C-3',4' desaturase CrtD
MNSDKMTYDIIVVGSGMGGLTAASLLANYGMNVLVLEAASAIGGCSSSYYRKGYIFETGATTLTGFDQHQPLRLLEDKLGLEIPKLALHPSMQVHMNGTTITRWQDRNLWIQESIRHFGESDAQRAFWERAFKTADIVWKVSSQNNYFPPISTNDWLQLTKNELRNIFILPHTLKSVHDTASAHGITNPEFYRFLDEQLMITAQAKSDKTPFLFDAPAITYTNYTNYYVPGGLINMAETMAAFIASKNGSVFTREKVLNISETDGVYTVRTSKNKIYHAEKVISNIPVWNLQDIATGYMKTYFKQESLRYNKAWGAFTLGVVTDDHYPAELPLHHQVHIPDGTQINGIESDSIFVSFSKRGDTERAANGKRVLNISTHSKTGFWFSGGDDYDALKKKTEFQILEILRNILPGFSDANIEHVFSATPVTWKKWVYRKSGRVGGIPQSMSRSLLDWTPVQTPFKGLFLCGDTVYPGQGIPGVTLSGINVFHRIIR